MKSRWAFVCLAALTAGLSSQTSRAAAGNPNLQQLNAAIRVNDLGRMKAILRDPALANAADARGITPLMYAAEAGSPEAMRILIHRGANVNARNQFGSTALMWSVADPVKVNLLLKHGADVNVKSNTGRTALLIASYMNPSAEVVRALLAKGADPLVRDQSGLTTLNAAAFANDLETIRLMVDAGVDVNAPDGIAASVAAGVTPLMNAAANGNLEAVKLLLAKGADVNAASSREKLSQVKMGKIQLGGFTPVALASAYGSAEVVKTLLEAGADPNIADIRNMTPLMLAAASDHGDPEIARVLMAHHADPRRRDVYSNTALDWARKNGRTGDTVTLAAAAPSGTPSNQIPDVRTAVERSVKLLEETTSQFFAKGGCASCHAHTPTEMVVSSARAKGIPVNENRAAERRQQIISLLNPAGPMLLERFDPPGAPDTTAYLLEALSRGQVAPSPVTDAVVANLASQQYPDGRWHFPGITRAPIEDGDFARTALAIRALNAYGAPGRAAEYRSRVERAKRWLLSAEATTAEDRAMRLAGLAAAGAKPETLRLMAQPILSRQRPDGSWGQRDELTSDAYATGMALWALAESGVVKPQDPQYRKGVRYLLQTQASDGSWYVASRAAEIQPYFESGFPYGHSQFISAMATGWAANALALAVDGVPGQAAGGAAQ